MRILQILAVLLAAAFLGPVAAAQQPGTTVRAPEQLRRLADQLFERQRFEEARDVYAQIQPLYAKDADLNRNLGWSFYRSRRPDILKAIQYWTIAWKLREDEPLQLEAARAYARIGRFDDGAQLLLALAKAHPQHTEHWAELAELAESAHRYPEAIAWYRSYLERKAGDANARLELAKILGWNKQYAEAIAEYNVVLQSNPRNTTAEIGVARVYAWQGQYPDALRIYDSVLERQPANVEARTGKAFALLWMGKPAEAKPLFEALERRNPRDAEVKNALREIARLEAEAEARMGQPVAGKPAVLPPPDPAGALLREADQAMAEGDGNRAAAALQRLLQLRPGDVPIQVRLARALVASAQFDAALSLLEKLRASNPGNSDVLRELAAAQSSAGKTSDAADTLAAYLKLKPDDRDAQLQHARLLSWSRRFDEASAAYKEVLSRDPENIESELGLAQISAWRGYYAVALKQFDAVLARKPDQREALIGKSQALFWSGKSDIAFQMIEQLRERLPGDREVASVLESFRDAERKRTAESAAVSPDVDSLIRSYRDILTRNPRDFEALRMLGELYARKNNFTEATAYYRQAHEQKPDDRQIELTLARMLSWNKQYTDSIRYYRDLTHKDENPDYVLELAKVLSWAGRHNDSIEAYRRVLELQPNLNEARLGLARVLSWSRNYDQSLDSYRLLLQRDPKNREARVEYARVTAWKGDLGNAVKLYSDLDRDYPNDREIRLGKAQTLQWSGRVREAREILEPLHAEYPKDKEVLLAAAGTQFALGRRDQAMRQLDTLETLDPGNRDAEMMRSLILKQVRPRLVLEANPSFDSDNLQIYSYASTLYFSPTPNVRSYVRAAVIPSMIDSEGITQGRELVFGSSTQLTDRLIIRGEIGGVSLEPGGRQSPIGGGGFTLTPTHQMRVDFDVARQFLDYLPRATRLGIHRVQLRAGWQYRPVTEWLFRLDYTHGRYSDSNRSNAADLTVLRTLYRGERLTVEGGYLYSAAGFAKQLNSGYFAPSQLERHALQSNVFGRLGQRFGYNVTGTFGAEQVSTDPFRKDGTVRATTDFYPTQRLRLSVGYGYFRIASLARAGAYRTHSATFALDVVF